MVPFLTRLPERVFWWLHTEMNRINTNNSKRTVCAWRKRYFRGLAHAGKRYLSRRCWLGSSDFTPDGECRYSERQCALHACAPVWRYWAVQFYHKGMADTGHIEMTRLSQSHFVYTQMFALCRALENKSPEGWKPRGAASGVVFSFNLLFEVLLLWSRKYSAPLCFC